MWLAKDRVKFSCEDHFRNLLKDGEPCPYCERDKLRVEVAKLAGRLLLIGELTLANQARALVDLRPLNETIDHRQPILPKPLQEARS